MKILVVDDSKTVRTSLNVALLNSTHEIFEAENGIEGLAMAFEKKPDLMFIDVLMPRLDGLQLCQMLKKLEWSKHIFVCMLTAKDTLLDRAQIKNYGADFLILKPFKAQSLLEHVAAIENGVFAEKIL